MAFTPTNPIGTDGSNANNNLGLELYTGEVLAAFDRNNKALATIKKRSISGGTSAQFIVTGKGADTDAATHTAGTAVTTKVLKVNERTITISDRVYFSHFVDELDLKLSQYEIRGEMAKQAAEALSTKIDKQVFVEMEAFISTGAGVADQSAGAVLQADLSNAVTNEAKGDLLVDALFEAQAVLNGKDVPTMDRMFMTTSQNYYYLVQSSKAINVDFKGAGSIAEGNVMKVAGLPIEWTNNLPAAATSTNALHGIVYTPDVFGVVTAMDIKSEANYMPETLGYLLTSYYALGMGGLNPACGVVIEEKPL